MGCLCDPDAQISYEIVCLEEYFSLNLENDITIWRGRSQLETHKSFMEQNISENDNITIEPRKTVLIWIDETYICQKSVLNCT